MAKKLVVVSHSGGLDSTTLLYKCMIEGYDVLPVSFRYGQKNDIEELAQKSIIEKLNNTAKKEVYGNVLKTLEIDLTSSFSNVTKIFNDIRDSGEIEESTDLEYYMPFRNMNFISMCSMIGEIISIKNNYDEVMIAVGVHKHSDESYLKDYWDITKNFVDRMNDVLLLNDNKFTKFSIYAPYKDSFKSKIIEDASIYGVPYELTWTCYNPQKEFEYDIVEKYSKIREYPSGASEVFADSFKREEFFSFTPCGKCEACKERQLQANKSNIPQYMKDKINKYSFVKSFVSSTVESHGVDLSDVKSGSLGCDDN